VRAAQTAHQLCSALFRTTRLPAGWLHISAAGAGGQCRDELMKTKRALCVSPLVATSANLKQNLMGYSGHDFQGLCNTAGK